MALGNWPQWTAKNRKSRVVINFEGQNGLFSRQEKREGFERDLARVLENQAGVEELPLPLDYTLSWVSAKVTISHDIFLFLLEVLRPCRSVFCPDRGPA